ncbi:hypothetical protein B6U81_06435 [Thermoplasmatales archaeon ex4484_30]|nr:MAG: hypothetical protein B6U81_06435 [Thermoplasmatales archaeon ex4484_30]
MPNVEEMLLKILSSYNVCSREWVIRQYDFEVRGCTVIKPMHGDVEMQTHADAVVIKPLRDSFKGLAITSDINPYFTSLNVYWGTCSAIDEACRNLASVGARGNPIYVIGETKKEMGGSEYYKCMGLEAGIVPRSEPSLLKRSVEKVVEAIENGLIVSCHDVSNGGIGIALAEMVIGGKGAEVCLYSLPNLRTDIKLFSETNTRWVVEVRKEKEEDFRKLFSDLKIYKIGSVKGRKLIVYDGDEMEKFIDIDKEELHNAWSKRLWEEMA